MIDISAFKPTFVYTIYIASTPDKVWQAVTTAEFSRQYFSGFAVELQERVGGQFVVRTPDGSEHITGKVIACEPPLRLVVTWDVNWPGLIEALGRTLVSYDIEQVGDAVRLTLTQSNDRPLDDDILSGGRAGWPAILSSRASWRRGRRRPSGWSRRRACWRRSKSLESSRRDNGRAPKQD